MEATAVEEVVTEDQRTAVAVEEVLTDDEGLGDAVGFGLGGVRELDAPLGAVAEQPFEGRAVDGRRDDQDLP